MSQQLKHSVPGGTFYTFNQRPTFPFVEIKQTHSSDIYEVKNSINKEGDGLIQTSFETHSLCIKTADCLPIYLYSKTHQALVHAGWRGLYQKILSSLKIKQMKPSYAFIGPAINQENYEVGEEFRDYFDQTHLQDKQAKLNFDLKAQAKSYLLAEYPEIKVEVCALDTYTLQELHSFRLNKTDQRNYNIFIPHTKDQ